MTVRILCVADGGLPRHVMEEMEDLTKLGAEVTVVDEPDVRNQAELMDRMALIEREGLGAAPTSQAILDNCADVDVLVVHIATINREVLDAAPNLKLAVVLRGGHENADTEALAEKGIHLINAPWRSANAVADFTVGMMIAENKNIARSHYLLKSGTWCKKYVNQDYIHDLRTRTVGIVGFGNIGTRVATRLKGFGSKLVGFDPHIDDEVFANEGVERIDSLDDLLKRSDYVTLHMRTAPETHHMIDAHALSLMKKTAYLINTARSELVDEKALADALGEHRIGGAAIDVFDTEPLPEDHPYLSLDNITLTSHLAGTSVDTVQTSVEIGIEELTRYLKGEPLKYVLV